MGIPFLLFFTVELGTKYKIDKTSEFIVKKCPGTQLMQYLTQNNCEYCGSYIITSLHHKQNRLHMILTNSKLKNRKIFFHEIEMNFRYAQVWQISIIATKSDRGRLLLTNQRLIFCAHALNINPNLYWALSLKEVNRAELGLNLLNSQRVKIFDVKGNEITFVVYGGKNWIDEIEHV